jgi:hypothetical protein
MFRLFCLSSRWATVKQVGHRFLRAARTRRDWYLTYAHLHIPRTPAASIGPRPIGRISGGPSKAIRMAHETSLGHGDTGDMYPHKWAIRIQYTILNFHFPISIHDMLLKLLFDVVISWPLGWDVLAQGLIELIV